MKKDIYYWSNMIFDYLMAYQQRNPEFRFLPRSNKDKNGRLLSGQWFQGSDYLNVSLVPRSGGNHSTKQIGFEVSFKDPDKPKCYLVLVYKKEPLEQIRQFYEALKKELRPLGLEEFDDQVTNVLPYQGDILEALELCLTRDVPAIQRLIKVHDVGQWLNISLNAMHNKINKIQELRTESGVKAYKIARICWNCNNWVYPSGPEGKSINPDTYEVKSGFGHEEWLFDFDKLIDGYQYGFLQPISDHPTYFGQMMDIQLYTIFNQTKERFWVGVIENVEVLQPETRNEIKQVYQENGWAYERKQQLADIGIHKTSEDIPGGMPAFNIRFKPADLELFDMALFDAQDKTRVLIDNYRLLDFSPSKQEEAEALENEFQPSAPSKAGDTTLTRTYRVNSVELPDTHAKIVFGLYGQLVQQHGAAQVSCERLNPIQRTRIDISVKVENGEVFYEVKSYPSIKECIRVALGQLMEYCYFPNVKRAQKLVIVSNLEATDSISEYMQHLRKELALNIWYARFDLEKGVLGEEV